MLHVPGNTCKLYTCNLLGRHPFSDASDTHTEDPKGRACIKEEISMSESGDAHGPSQSDATLFLARV